MPATLVSIKNIPKLGFAHHIYTEEAHQTQNDIKNCFVLVYVKSGHLTVQIYGRLFDAPAGSILILFRHIPFQIHSADGNPQDYCSIQVYAEYSFALMDDNEDFPQNFNGLALPIVTPNCSETENIKKDMFTIISNLSISRERYSNCSAMALCGILSRLDSIYRQKLYRGKSVGSYWEHRIKRYIADHIKEKISLNILAAEMKLTPNYLNSVFSQSSGISVHQYINREKMQLAANLMETQNLSFAEACENVGITDLSHGYRLFKKYMGVTPKGYQSAERVKVYC